MTRWSPFLVVVAASLGLGVLVFWSFSSSRGPFSVGEVDVDLRELWARGSWEEIRTYTDVEIQKDPLRASYLFFGGVSRFYAALQTEEEVRQELLKEAVMQLRRLLATDRAPLLAETHYILGKAYFYRGRFYSDLSLHHLQEALRLGIGYPDIHGYLGLVSSHLERYSQALHHFHRALQDGDEPLLRWSLAYVYYKLEDYGKTIENLEKAMQNLEDKPLEIKCRYLLGEAYLKLGDLDRAESQYRSLLDTDPLLPEAHYFLGEIALARGEPEKARAYWRRALQLDPYHYNAAMRLRGNQP